MKKGKIAISVLSVLGIMLSAGVLTSCQKDKDNSSESSPAPSTSVTEKIKVTY